MHAACPLGDLGGGAGFGEILLVLAAVLVLFGPRRLPEFARTLGRILMGLQRASAEFRDQVMRIEDAPPGSPADGGGEAPRTPDRPAGPDGAPEAAPRLSSPANTTDPQGAVGSPPAACDSP